MGLFATKTNVSAEDFGEGSFDKGITFSMPLYALQGGTSRNRQTSVIRPIMRDGGAQLSGHNMELWDLLRPYKGDFLEATKTRLLHP